MLLARPRSIHEQPEMPERQTTDDVEPMHEGLVELVYIGIILAAAPGTRRLLSPSSA